MSLLGFSSSSSSGKKRQKSQQETKSGGGGRNSGVKFLKITEVVEGGIMDREQVEKRSSFIK
jgi:hypothetical protein